MVALGFGLRLPGSKNQGPQAVIQESGKTYFSTLFSLVSYAEILQISPQIKQAY